MTLQRSMFGVHAPVRLMMERNLVQQVRLFVPLLFCPSFLPFLLVV